MKKFIIPLIGALVVVAILVGTFFWWRTNSQPVALSQERTRFVIPRGYSATQIGEALFAKGLIRSPFAFKVYAQITGKAGEIQAGEFTLSPSLSLTQVVERLTSGPEELWVTIPEGLRREEIVEKVIVGLELTGVEARAFRSEFLDESQGLEGFLFPDTYLFPRDITAGVVIAKLRDTFDVKTEDLNKDIAKSGYTLNQLITLASIIERETITSEERPVVAGILLKRVSSRVAMQADATVQYAIANERCTANSEQCDWWPEILRTDLEINSAYNTYKFSGFPPAPIASPGYSSIQASVNPESTDYWYYLHDSEGNIHYAETLSQHNDNIKKYLGK